DRARARRDPEELAGVPQEGGAYGLARGEQPEEVAVHREHPGPAALADPPLGDDERLVGEAGDDLTEELVVVAGPAVDRGAADAQLRAHRLHLEPLALEEPAPGEGDEVGAGGRLRDRRVVDAHRAMPVGGAMRRDATRVGSVPDRRSR